MTEMPIVTLPSGETLPVLGQGTYRMAMDPSQRATEIAALRAGLDLGMKVIDTAEMYAEGKAEELVGEAIAGRRDETFIVTKVVPFNADYDGTLAACERSLKRLATDRIDLYLLHWRGQEALTETLDAFEQLKADGKIRYWGVSNFDLPDMREVIGLVRGKAVAVNQVHYNLARRGIEWDLLPWCRERRIPIMAYCPLGEGKLLSHPAIVKLAERRGIEPAQVALAWILFQAGVMAIPKASTPEHVRLNREALDLKLTHDERAELSVAFPPPRGPVKLSVV